MIDLEAVRQRIRRSPFTPAELVRLCLGSFLSSLTIPLYFRIGLDAPLTAAPVPLLLTLIGVLLVWPVVFRVIFRPATRSREQHSYRLDKNDD